MLPYQVSRSTLLFKNVLFHINILPNLVWSKVKEASGSSFEKFACSPHHSSILFIFLNLDLGLSISKSKVLSLPKPSSHSMFYRNREDCSRWFLYVLWSLPCFRWGFHVPGEPSLHLNIRKHDNFFRAVTGRLWRGIQLGK